MAEEDESKVIIRIDGMTRSKAEVSLGENVIIRVVTMLATWVMFAPKTEGVHRTISNPRSARIATISSFILRRSGRTRRSKYSTSRYGTCPTCSASSHSEERISIPAMAPLTKRQTSTSAVWIIGSRNWAWPLSDSRWIRQKGHRERDILVPRFTGGLHASGHASKEELVDIIERIRPEYLVPVHTENPEYFLENVTCVPEKKILIANSGEKLMIN